MKPLKFLQGFGLLMISLAFFSCSSLGTRINDLSLVKDSQKAYLVARLTVKPEVANLENPEIIVTDAYSFISKLEMHAADMGAGSPMVYSIEPGTYFIRVAAVQKGNFFTPTTVKLWPLPYPLEFVFTVKPGQVVYLGDYSFSESGLSINYNLDKIKAEVGSVQPESQGFDWVSLDRPIPSWAK